MTGLEPFLLTAMGTAGVSSGVASAVTAVTSALPTIASIAGTATGVLGAVQGAQSAKAAGKLQQQQLAAQQAQLKAAGELQVFQQEKRNRQLRSAQLAQIGKAGIAPPLALIEKTAAEQELDLLVTKYNTQLGISDIEAQKQLAGFEAEEEAKRSLLTIPTILQTGITALS